MIGILTLVQNLFYLTDDQAHDNTLSYYRQREWRLIGGLSFKGIPHGRPLTDNEKLQVQATDERFRNRVIADNEGSLRRIDEAVVIDVFEDRKIVEFISTVFVPSAAYDRAKAILGDIVARADRVSDQTISKSISGTTAFEPRAPDSLPPDLGAPADRQEPIPIRPDLRATSTSSKPERSQISRRPLLSALQIRLCATRGL